MNSDEEECSTPGCTLYAGHMQTCNPPKRIQTHGGWGQNSPINDAAPGSLFDKNRCWHQVLLGSSFKSVGTGYHDSMKFTCEECGVGLHVSYATMAKVMDAYPTLYAVAELLEAVGVALSSGYLPTCITPYAHAAHRNCPGITEEEEGHK